MNGQELEDIYVEEGLIHPSEKDIAEELPKGSNMFNIINVIQKKNI